MADTDSADRDTATDTGAAMLVTTDVAAAMAGVSARTVRRWIQRGFLPATQSPEGYLVSPADLATARAAAGHGHGQVRGHGHRPAVTDADTATSAPPVVVSPSASAQLAAIRDEWLQPLVDRIAELERERGRLEAQRDTAAQTIEELRRRAEAAERECEEIRQRHDALRASAIFSGSPTPPAATSEADEHEHDLGDLRPLGRLQRLWRAIRGA